MGAYSNIVECPVCGCGHDFDLMDYRVYEFECGFCRRIVKVEQPKKKDEENYKRYGGEKKCYS